MRTLVLVAQLAVTDPVRESDYLAHLDTGRMQRDVRDLVTLGPRMGGTPSGEAASAHLRRLLDEAGLETELRLDPPRDAYQPLEVHARVRAGTRSVALTDGWLCFGSPSVERTELPLVWLDDPARGSTIAQQGPYAAVLPLSSRRTMFRMAVEDRPQVVLWIAPGRSRRDSTPILSVPQTWTGAVYTVSQREDEALDELRDHGEPCKLEFHSRVFAEKARPRTVLATLPQTNEEEWTLLFCAHGDSDAGGPGADDNASGEAVVLEIARGLARLAENGWRPPFQVRFAIWGSEIHSSRAYRDTLPDDPRHLAVINYDQAGTGQHHECLYLEPDDLPGNRPLMELFRQCAADHRGADGLWPTFTSNRALGGTDSYVFMPDWRRGGSARDLAAFTFFTAAFGSREIVQATDGFPSPAFPDGTIEVDCSEVYHESADLPQHTTDREPHNMRWCAAIGGLAALRLARAPELWRD